MNGSIFDASVDAIVNPVNCVGVMGRGLAAQFKHAYPANFTEYAAVCQRGELQPGRLLVVATGQTAPRWIVNLPTKRHWRTKAFSATSTLGSSH